MLRWQREKKKKESYHELENKACGKWKCCNKDRDGEMPADVTIYKVG